MDAYANTFHEHGALKVYDLYLHEYFIAQRLGLLSPKFTGTTQKMFSQSKQVFK